MGAGCLTAFLVAVGGLFLFLLGPPRADTRKPLVLASLQLADNGRLFLIEERDGNLLEPYAVSLYRLDRSSNVHVSFLGDEYGHWWGAKLIPTTDTNRIEVKTFGMTQGFYSPQTGFTWTINKRGFSPNHLIDGKDVKIGIPSVVRP